MGWRSSASSSRTTSTRGDPTWSPLTTRSPRAVDAIPRGTGQGRGRDATSPCCVQSARSAARQARVRPPPRDRRDSLRVRRATRLTRAAVGALLLLARAAAAEPSLPPGERPFEVSAGFFLVNLSGVAERSETFDADVYLSFRWRDPRLAFEGSEPRRYLEDQAVARLGEMWWPQLEFVNTAEATYTNRSLTIEPDGTVDYVVAITSEFRTDLDLRRFPLDSQTLTVSVESFTWRDDQMVFVPDRTRLGFNHESTFEGLVVTGVDARVERREVLGWGEAYSDLVATIDVRRQAAFYIWTVFVPVTLIFLI